MFVVKKSDFAPNAIHRLPGHSLRKVQLLRSWTNMNDQMLREHLLDVLRGKGAHLTFDKAVADLPAALRGATYPSAFAG